MADSLKDDLLPLLDELRGIPGELGFRPYQVHVRTVAWSGDRVGRGTQTVTDTRLRVGGNQDPKVRALSRKDVVAGNIAFVEGKYDIGPLTPSYAGGGIPDETINPTSTSTPTEVFFVITGPGTPSTGLLCKRVGDHVDRAMRRMIRVESLGRAA
jgi:hypothetical protein